MPQDLKWLLRVAWFLRVRIDAADLRAERHEAPRLPGMRHHEPSLRDRQRGNRSTRNSIGQAELYSDRLEEPEAGQVLNA